MTAKQMKDLLRNMSKEKNINAQILQRNYMMERLLERISLSQYKDNFILKGGMLVASLVGIDTRSTMDFDATIKGLLVSEKTMSDVFNNLVQMDIGDGVVLKIKRIEEIREEFEYSCFRISMEAIMDNTVIPLKVDVSTGDTITPSEINYEFSLLLEKRTIKILAYNLETVLAEKMETILSKTVFNTRMRDFYDLYILAKLRKNNIDMQILADAILKTAEKRNTIIIYEKISEDLDTIFYSKEMFKLWQNYQRKFPYAKEVSWKDVESRVRDLFGNVVKSQKKFIH